jgi:hypothetical protein
MKRKGKVISLLFPKIFFLSDQSRYVNQMGIHIHCKTDGDKLDQFALFWKASKVNKMNFPFHLKLPSHNNKEEQKYSFQFVDGIQDSLFILLFHFMAEHLVLGVGDDRGATWYELYHNF